MMKNVSSQQTPNSVSPVISMHYEIDQTTAQRFNNEAACNFLDHEQPLLSCVLNRTVTFKGSSVIDDNNLQIEFVCAKNKR